jgi:hypothetical protein
MTVAIGRRIVLGSALAAPFIRTARADPIRMRVSLDTSPDGFDPEPTLLQ